MSGEGRRGRKGEGMDGGGEEGRKAAEMGAVSANQIRGLVRLPQVTTPHLFRGALDIRYADDEP